MATRRYKINPGQDEFAITEEAGAAVNSHVIELTVEMADTAVSITGGTRKVDKSEVILALDKIKNHLIKSNWPPA